MACSPYSALNQWLIKVATNSHLQIGTANHNPLQNTFFHRLMCRFVMINFMLHNCPLRSARLSACFRCLSINNSGILDHRKAVQISGHSHLPVNPTWFIAGVNRPITGHSKCIVTYLFVIGRILCAYQNLGSLELIRSSLTHCWHPTWFTGTRMFLHVSIVLFIY